MNSVNRKVCLDGCRVGILWLTVVTLAFVAQLLLKQGSMPYALFVLYVANWFVLGFISWLLAAVWLLIRTKSTCKAPDLAPIWKDYSHSYRKSIERHALWDR